MNFCHFHISLQACVKRGIRDIIMPLSHCEIRENRHGGKCTLLKLLNEIILPCFRDCLSHSDKIRF